MEIVISAHKSVAELGVIGQAEAMHRIIDAERDATLAYLDKVTREMGGRRGEASEGHTHRRPHLLPYPPCHLQGRGPVPSRSHFACECPGNERRAGRAESRRHGPVARAPSRRHHGRPARGSTRSRSNWVTASSPTPGHQASSATG